MKNSNAPLASLVIVSWNSAKYLPRCLECLSSQTFQFFEVIVVDNGSSDGSVADLEKQHPQLDLKVERLASNRGFAAANNLGAELARGEWLILLNTDAFPEVDWLETLIKTARDNPQYTCFSSRQLQANKPELLDGAGDCYHISGLAWKRCMGYPSGEYGLEIKEVFSPCGAAAMYSRNAFLDVGGFDEDFFSYLEDVDLGFRLRLRGHRCLYVPDAVVHHIGSASLGVASDFALYHYHRNLIWSFVQNMPPSLIWRYMFAHLAANLIYLVTYILRGRGKVLWKAKMDALHGLARARKKRGEIQSRRSVTAGELVRVMERGWSQPYLLEYHLRRIQPVHSGDAKPV
jgi:GT2 family glycosyltransferase